MCCSLILEPESGKLSDLRANEIEGVSGKNLSEDVVAKILESKIQSLY